MKRQWFARVIFLFLICILTSKPSDAKACEVGVAGISVTLDKVKDIETSSVSGSELTALYRIVEAEATGETIECKKNVTSVILNRAKNKDFPDSIIDVVFQKDQFSPISDRRYWSVEVTEDTIQAVNNVLTYGTTTEALYFCNMDKVSKKMERWFDSLDFLFKDKANHSFFK